jgi:DNA topoisomerase-1
MAPDELTLQKAIELLAAPSGERELGIDPITSLPIIAKSGRFGPYITEVLPEEEGKKKKKEVKAKTASLLSTMTLDTVTLDDALKLLSLPKVLGVDSETGEEITVQNGRYGPYLKRGADSRTLTSEDQLFSITLDEASEIYKQPKVRRRGVAKPPLKDLGVDPDTKRQIIIKDGRFGMYVTDGETNATLRRGDTVEAMTIERAQELLAGRRAWELENGGAPKKKSSRKKKAPTLTEKTISDAGAKRKSKRSATGKAKKSKE